MADTTKQVKYSIDGDASGLVSAAKKGRDALEGTAKAGNSGKSKEVSTLDNQGKSIAKLAGEYKKLEGAKAFFDKEPAQIKRIVQEQQKLLDQRVQMAKSAQDYARYSKEAAAFAAKNDTRSQYSSKPATPPLPSSNQVGVIGSFIAGELLKTVGGAIRQTASKASNSYADLNRQYTFDNGLRDSERRNQRAELNLGRQMSGYNQFKNNVAATGKEALANNPALAIGADIGGMALGVAGTALPILSSLKMLKGAKAGADLAKGTKAGLDAAKVAKTGAGLAGAAGTAGEVATGASFMARAGTMAGWVAAKTPLALVGLAGGVVANHVGSQFLNGTSLPDLWDNQNRTRQRVQNDPQFKDLDKLSATSKETLKNFSTELIVPLRELQKSRANWQGGQAGLVANKEAEDAAIKTIQAIEKKYGRSSGLDEKTLRGGALQTDQLLITHQETSKKLGGTGEDTKSAAQSTFKNVVAAGAQAANNVTMQQIIKSPQYQLQLRARINSLNDFYEDYSTQKFRTNRNFDRAQADSDKNYSRTTEDLDKSKKRTIQDYGIGKQKIAIGRNRAKEDYTLSVEQNSLQTYRVTRDANIQLGRLDEDYKRNKLRLTEDTNKNVSRLVADGLKNIARLQEDATRNRERLEETSSTNSKRLEEDTSRSKLRAAQDYTRSRTELERSNSRNNADLDQSYQDSVLGILAPGLTSSPAYQLMKLTRDYKKNKSRAAEDYAFGREGLELSRSRSNEDIDRQYDRGREDISRDKRRGNEDIDRDLRRGLEDANTGMARGLEDAATAQRRGEEDIERETARAQADLLRQTNDALIDSSKQLYEINLQYKRSLQDLDMASRELTTGFLRALEDIATASKRAAEDKATDDQRRKEDRKDANDDLERDKRRRERDEQLKNDEERRKLQDQTGATDPMSRDDYSGATGIPNYGGQPGFAVGTNYVAKTGMALIHEGEAIIPADKNPYPKDSSKGFKGFGGGNTGLDARNGDNKLSPKQSPVSLKAGFATDDEYVADAFARAAAAPTATAAMGILQGAAVEYYKQADNQRNPLKGSGLKAGGGGVSWNDGSVSVGGFKESRGVEGGSDVGAPKREAAARSEVYYQKLMTEVFKYASKEGGGTQLGGPIGGNYGVAQGSIGYEGTPQVSYSGRGVGQRGAAPNNINQGPRPPGRGSSTPVGKSPSILDNMTPEQMLQYFEGAGTPRYATGTGYVPETGPAILHKGEAVIPADKNPFRYAGLNGLNPKDLPNATKRPQLGKGQGQFYRMPNAKEIQEMLGMGGSNEPRRYGSVSGGFGGGSRLTPPSGGARVNISPTFNIRGGDGLEPMIRQEVNEFSRRLNNKIGKVGY